MVAVLIDLSQSNDIHYRNRSFGLKRTFHIYLVMIYIHLINLRAKTKAIQKGKTDSKG